MMRRRLPAAILAAVVAVTTATAAVAQVNPVYKQDPVTGNATQQQQITVPNGFSDTYNPGSVLDCNGCTPTGFPFGAGNVTGPASATSGDLPDFSDATGKALSDSGVPAANVVSGPASATAGNVAEFNGATGKALQNGPPASVTVNGVSCSLGNACTAGRTILTANQSYFVNCSTGSDSNNGSSGSPWATLTHAYSFVQQNLDLAGQYVVTINIVASCTLSTSWTLTGKIVGSPGFNGFTITGHGFTITGPNNLAIMNATQGAEFTIEDTTLIPGATGGNGLVIFDNGVIAFGAGASTLFFNGQGHNLIDISGPGALAKCAGTVEITGVSAFNAAFLTEDHGQIELPCQVTLNGAPVYTVFVQGDLGGMVDATGFTTSGGAPTGSRFNAISNGIVFTGGSGGANFFPGSTAGTTNTGGFYQ